MKPSWQRGCFCLFVCFSVFFPVDGVSVKLADSDVWFWTVEIKMCLEANEEVSFELNFWQSHIQHYLTFVITWAAPPYISFFFFTLKSFSLPLVWMETMSVVPMVTVVNEEQRWADYISDHIMSTNNNNNNDGKCLNFNADVVINTPSL